MNRVLHAVPSVLSPEINLRDALAARLKKGHKVSLTNAGLGTFQTYDMNGRVVLYIGAKTDQPYCLVPVSLAGALFGNSKLRELPMTISCLRTAGKSVRPILNCGAFDAISVTYGLDEFAVAIDAGLLLEKLK